MRIVSKSPENTQSVGEKLGQIAQAGDIFLLTGDLGAGKTCLTQGVARGLGVKGYVSSPSFVVVKEHHGRIPLYHVDLYRLERLEEVLDLGLDDYLYGKGLCVIEWAEKGWEALPHNHLLIIIDLISDTERSLCIKPRGNRYRDLVAELQVLLGSPDATCH